MAKRITTPGANPKFMHNQEFEQEAVLLLAEYGNVFGQVTAPPVPIDDIVAHFKIATEFKDLRTEFPEGDVLGAIWFNDKRMSIDLTLDPDTYPSMLGRYRFTLAHELAHWRLHRYFYLRRAGEQSMFPKVSAGPDHVLRSGKPDPKEYQANQLAACILMPREFIKRAWHEWRGEMEPIYLPDLRVAASANATDKLVLENACRPLAKKFEVSPEAMRIRLEKLALLMRKKVPTLFA